jgi:hypothetical protein
MSEGSARYPHGASRKIEDAERLLGEALDILDCHGVPTNLRARLSEVISGLAEWAAGRAGALDVPA